jgi:dTMP kinase
MPVTSFTPEASTVQTPVMKPPSRGGRSAEDTAVLRPVASDTGHETTVLRSVSGDSEAHDSEVHDSEVTAELPQPPAPAGAADETAVLPPVSAAEETAVLPPVVPGAADETAVLPPVRGQGPSDRVPASFFRDERPAGRADGEDRTRELPQVDEQGAPRRRQRSDWAEETPLDDLPSLADELLGPREDGDHDDDTGRGPGRGRGRGRRG